MKLVSAIVGPYKSLTSAQEIMLDEHVTVVVGQNEAGKSAVLEAINKTRPIPDSDHGYRVLYDFPRKELTRYERANRDHKTEVVRLTYRLSEAEKMVAEAAAGTSLTSDEFGLVYYYDNSSAVTPPSIDETASLQAFLTKQTLHPQAQFALKMSRLSEPRFWP